MINIVEKFLDAYDVNKADKTFLVGFSGGCDSLCLLDILHKLSNKTGFRLLAMHLNHNWRGQESLQEEQNCATFCQKNNIEFISEKLAETQPKTEIAARDARYSFFLKHAKNYPNPIIFTAHTSSDNAETVIYRIIKGTGINGLQGILPLRNIDDIPVLRPILSLSRCQTEDYCNANGLVPNNDSSNYDINYKRNFIRHKIMPLFNEINFHAEKSINSLSKLAVSQTSIVNEYIGLIKNDIYQDNKILTDKFKNLSQDIMSRIIYDGCLKFGLDYDYKKVNNILNFIKNNFDSKSGSRYSLASNLWLFVNNKNIYVIDKVKSEINTCEVITNGEGDYNFSENLIFSIEKFSGGGNVKYPEESEKIAFVDLSNVGLNLTIRTRRDGDYITPFGMSGKMKLKKYLNSKGIIQHEKNKLILLCKNSEILWVCGVGLSNKLKVVKEPTHVLRLTDSL